MNYVTPKPLIKEICRKFVHDNWSSEEIAEWIISTGRYGGRGKPENVGNLIRKILYRYRDSLKIDRNYEEVKQKNRICRKIKKKELEESKRDQYDWESLLSDKITKKQVEHSGEVKGNETHIYITNLRGNALIQEAIKRNIPLPEEIQRRIVRQDVKNE